jgi:hypothetical protein
MHGLFQGYVCYQDRRQTVMVRGSSSGRKPDLWRLFLFTFLSMYLADSIIAAPRPEGANDRIVTKVVDEYFSSQPVFQKGDLVTRSDIKKVLDKLGSKGMKIPDPDGIVKLGLPEDSFLVRELSTPGGKKFMRKIALQPGAYSHVDRLSTIPRGQSIIRDLIRTKDGDKMIEYLATTKGGKNMSGMMGQTRGGVDLSKPTGRIYTADDLKSALNNAMAKP